ncbi:MAG: hypothetical protein ACYCOU_17410, partial [Sulfobacillus sp.]
NPLMSLWVGEHRQLAIVTPNLLSRRTRMTQPTPTPEAALHRQWAIDLFNATWEYMDNPHRSPTDDTQMIHMAHASRYHWGVVGTPLNLARGEWQISRVYALVSRWEPSLYHATASLHWCLDNNLGPFDWGFAYEALARSYALHGDHTKRDQYLELARQVAQTVDDEADRDWLRKNIESVMSLSIPPWE